VVNEQLAEVNNETQVEATNHLNSEDVIPHQQAHTQADSKQARIATAVAKAKTKREAQKAANSQDVPNLEAINKKKPNQIPPAQKVDDNKTSSPDELANTEAQQVEVKKRRIAVAVAKAKAKKAAEKNDKLL
jgi:electron transport complex protein RnfC